jgi:hypothetical protein
MTIAEISHQIQSIGFLSYIRKSGYTCPMILSTHLATIAGNPEALDRAPRMPGISKPTAGLNIPERPLWK